MASKSPKFQKGKSGNPAGRPKGSKNKLNGKVWDICEKWGCNPLEVLCWLATDNLWEDDKKIPIKPRVMMEAASELAAYCYPKLKQIEYKSEDKSNFIANIFTSHSDIITAQRQEISELKKQIEEIHAGAG